MIKGLVHSWVVLTGIAHIASILMLLVKTMDFLFGSVTLDVTWIQAIYPSITVTVIGGIGFLIKKVKERLS